MRDHARLQGSLGLTSLHPIVLAVRVSPSTQNPTGSPGAENSSRRLGRTVPLRSGVNLVVS